MLKSTKIDNVHSNCIGGKFQQNSQKPGMGVISYRFTISGQLCLWERII